MDTLYISYFILIYIENVYYKSLFKFEADTIYFNAIKYVWNISENKLNLLRHYRKVKEEVSHLK